MKTEIDRLKEHFYEMMHEKAMLKEKRDSSCSMAMFEFYDSLYKCAAKEIGHTADFIARCEQEAV